MTPRRVAVVHDWLTGMRGGERVLESCLDVVGEADVFTLVHRPGSVSARIESHSIHTSFLNRVPGIGSTYPFFLPLFPLAVERLDLRGYDLIVSISHCAARGIRPLPGTPHLNYCLTPMRYVWDLYDDYFAADRSNPLIRGAMSAVAPYLRRWERRVTPRTDRLVTCSHHIADRVERVYGRTADAVVYPPVDVDRLMGSDASRDDFYLLVSALVPYKRVELAVQAFSAMGRRLVVVGRGRERARLERLAGPTVEFRGWVEQPELDRLLSRCRAFVFCAIEDFGIAPVEAQAAGAPVIAYRRGGLAETVRFAENGNADGASGVPFDHQTPEALVDAVERFERLTFDPDVVRHNARRFSRSRFEHEFGCQIEETLRRFSAD